MSAFTSYRRVTPLLIFVVMIMIPPEWAKGGPWSLRYVESYFDGDAGLSGLDGAHAAVISGDGKFVYVAGLSDHSIVIFSRDSATGALTYLHSVNEGENGITSLEPYALALSPAGEHLYVLGGPYFHRDATSGMLTPAVVPNISGLRMAISPDGKHVYSVGQPGDVYASSRDASTGALTQVETLAYGVNGLSGTKDGESLTVSPDGKHVYVVGYTEHAIAAFARDATTGKLTFVEALFDGQGGIGGLHYPLSVALSADGNHVYVASIGEGGQCIAVFSRNSTTGALTFVESRSNGGPQSFASSIAVSPDGNRVYTTNGSTAAACSFTRNPATGRLTFIEAEIENTNGVHDLDGAQGLIVSPDGKNVYIPAVYDKAITFFSCDTATGLMTFIGSIHNGTGGLDTLNFLSGLAVSPDGKNIYASSPYDDAVTVFARNETTGKLNLVESEINGINGVDGLDNPSYGIAVSPDGLFLYVGAKNGLAIFSRNPASGALTFLNAVSDGGTEDPQHLAFTPDGSKLYVSNSHSGGYAVFTRNIGTGALTLVQSGFLPGGGDAIDIGLSPDGAHAYIGINLSSTGGLEAGIALSGRDPSTGALTYYQPIDPPGNQPFIFSLTFSPDGRHLYASTGSVDIYERNAATGGLTRIGSAFGGRRVLVSPAGDFVLVLEDTITLFERNDSDGTLRFATRLTSQDDVYQFEASFPSTAVLSPDGRHIYVRANDGDNYGLAVVAIDGVNSAEDWVVYP